MAEPISIYQSASSTRIDLNAATGFLHVWLNAVLNAPLVVPAFCPGCHALAASVTIGRGQLAWFRVDPCTCLFEIVGVGE